MNRLARLLKSSRVAYNLYYFSMSFLLRVMGLFVGFDNKLLLFNSFGGKRYDDSPKVIYEKMLNDDRFKEYKIVWAIQDPNSIEIPGRATVVKADSFKYFVTALRAKVWITNSSIERGLNFKKKKTVCFNTWHGTAIKTMGIDIKEDNKSFKSRVLVRADVMLAQSSYDIKVFSRCFQLPESVLKLSGLPRNDCLATYSQNQADKIRESLGISKEKTILLYAPTFREYSRDTQKNIVLDIPINLQLWQESLGERFVVLFRAHYEVAKHMRVDDYPLFIDVSSYPNLNELMIVSDALISDYSSVFFDYSVMHKPMYCFAYDFDEYTSKRGMYIDLKDELPCTIHQNEEGLIEDLLNFDQNRNALCDRTRSFQEKFVTCYGHAAENSCNLILERL